MNRFSKYNLLKKFNGVRIIHKAIPSRDYGYVMPEAHIYRVQTHKSFLGIRYWETICKTTNRLMAETAYGYRIYGRQVVEKLRECNPDNMKDVEFVLPKDIKK